MITFEFGKSEKIVLDKNSIFIKFYGNDFKENVARIKSYWNRVYNQQTKEELQ